MSGRPVAGIFRLQMFKPSETFITAQAEAMARYRPLYIGRTHCGDGPEDAEAVAVGRGLGDAAKIAAGDPTPFLAALAGRRIDVLHAHFAVDAAFAAPLARRLGAPLVCTLHGFDVTRSDRSMLASGRPALMAAVLARRTLQRDVSLILAVSESIRQAALARGFDAERLGVHPTGVDVRRLTPGPTAERGLVVQVARLVEKKGTDTLLTAMAELAPTVPSARLVIVGDGPRRHDLARQARRLGLEDRVRFLGALPHEATLGWIARADVVAAPSRPARNGDAEGLPTVLLEAAALGRACVASRCAGAEAVIDGETGLLTPDGDAAALAGALRRLLSAPDLCARLGRAARARVCATYDLHRQTQALERRYDGLVAGARR